MAEENENLENQPISIIHIRSERRRLFILICLALAGLVLPFSDTVYLPALVEIEQELNTSTTLVDYTISTYLIAAACAGLFWGPLSDRFGRKIILILSFILFIGATIVCIFTRSIVLLMIFRSLQGAFIAASFIVGQSAIVDIYPSERLGFAMGLFLVPLLVGPIVGPFIGGILCNVFGWRSTFISLAIMAVLAGVLILAFVPETHHYFVLRKINQNNVKKRMIIIEAEQIKQPEFLAPWRPFVFLKDLTLTPHVLVCTLNFSVLFIHFTLLSNRVSRPPYSLTPFATGLCYIPTGVASLVGSLVGGWISDFGFRRIPRALEGRLLFNMLGSLLCPIGLLISGWTFRFECHLAGPLIGSTLFSFGEAFAYTGTSAFATVKLPAMTGAVLALISTISFLAAGIGIIIAIPIVEALEFGWFYTILAALLLVTLIISLLIILHRLRQSKSIRSFETPNFNLIQKF